MKKFIIIGEDKDLICIDEIQAITFGKNKYEVPVRFWFKGFYLDYVDVSEEEKEEIRNLLRNYVIIEITGKRREVKIEKREENKK
jgi:hypothetical protein